MEFTLLQPLHFKSPNWKLRSPEVLKKDYFLLGPSAFERGFRQKPYANEDRLFPHFIKNQTYFFGVDWRKISDPDCEEFYDPESKFFVDPSWSRYTGCDLGGRTKPKTVIYTIAVSPEGNRHLLDIKIGKWTGQEFGFNLEKTFIDPLLRAKKINVENNALQEYAIDLLKEMAVNGKITCFPYIKGFTTNRKKADPELGLPSIDVQYENRRWIIPIPHKENQKAEANEKNPSICGCAYCKFVHDTNNATRADLHDTTPDTIMAQYFAKEASRVGERFSLDSISIVSMSAAEIKGNAMKASPYRVDSEPQPFSVNRIMGNRNPEAQLTWFGTTREGYSKWTYKCETGCGSYVTRRGFDLPDSLSIKCGNCRVEKQFI